jgi:hypothetical protein
MLRRYFERLDTAADKANRGLWLCLAIFFAVSLGFQLGAYRYGHGDPQQLAMAMALLLMSAHYLVKERRLRRALWLAFAASVLIWVVVLVRFGFWGTQI